MVARLLSVPVFLAAAVARSNALSLAAIRELHTRNGNRTSYWAGFPPCRSHTCTVYRARYPDGPDGVDKQLPDIIRSGRDEVRPSVEWFDLLPPLPPVEARESVLINRGLPRTGTSAFALATALVGMRTLHSGLSKHCYTKPAPPWPVAGGQAPKGCEQLGYDAAADLPWFLGDSDDFRRAEPWPGLFRFVCTARPGASWTEGVVNHGSAGGKKMFDFISMLRLTPPSNFPYRDRASARPFLSAFHEWHSRKQCNPDGQIDLYAPEDAKWAVLCRHVPRRYAARCEAIRRAGACWPVANLNRRNTSQARRRDAERAHADCKPWPHGICSFARAQLPANRTFGGSVTGGWTDLKAQHSLDKVMIQCGGE